MSFAQRNEQRNASIKMVAFHLAWQPDYARFGIACLLSVLSSGAGLVCSAVGCVERGGKQCARRTWWWLVQIPNSHSRVDVDVDPCSCLSVLSNTVVCSDMGSQTTRPQNLVVTCAYPKFFLCRCRPLLFLVETNCLSKGSSEAVVIRMDGRIWW